MRCKRLWGALALLLAVAGGCKQRCFMTEADFNRTETTKVQSFMELSPELSYKQLNPLCPPPPTLNNLDRKVRFLSLAEAIAISLEQGTVGQPSLLFPGTAQDNLVSFAGPGAGTTSSDAIRVLALDYARVASNIELSLSKFDAFYSASAFWNNTDQPIGTSLQTFQAGQQPTLTSINTQAATVQTGVFKPLPTGGVAGITFGTNYTLTNLPARVNPAYQPAIQFGFDQPLMQGYGVEINQLRTSHPYNGNQFGATNAQFLAALANNGLQFQPPGVEGILVSRIRADEQRAEFERNLNQMLLNVEVAYWNLYGGYWTLYSREQGLRFAFEAFRLNKARYEAGRATAADFYQSRGQYELFRAQRLQAIDTVLENERQLRAMLGMPIEDGTRLMPSDSPTLAPYLPDWNMALEETMTRRPELYLARQEVKVAQMNLILAKNQLLPDLRFTGTYDFNGLGTRLDGPSTGPNGAPFQGNAASVVGSGNFSNWSAGIRLTIPLGYRQGHVQVRQAQIQLARSLETVNDQERKAERFLGLQYRRLSTAYEQIRANRAQREAFGEQLRARQQEFLAGRGTLDILLEAQRFWADALSNEYQAVVTYNNALVGFEFAKGTILQHDNVVISEGPLPCCAQVRAVEHERERTAALILRERAAPVAPALDHPEGLTPGKAPSLPAALSATPPLKDAPSLPAAPDASNVPAPQEQKIDELFPATPEPMTRMPAGKPKKSPSDFGTERQE